MDTIQSGTTFSDNGWTIYLLSLFVFIVLFFVQKYAYLIDRKLSQSSQKGSVWQSKPWPLVAALLLGFLTYLYNVFTPNDIQKTLLGLAWPEWLLIFCFGVFLVLLTFESFTHFGKRWGLIRVLIFVLLSAAFYLAGLLAGLILVTVLAFGILFYFILFWRKRISIK